MPWAAYSPGRISACVISFFLCPLLGHRSYHYFSSLPAWFCVDLSFTRGCFTGVLLPGSSQFYWELFLMWIFFIFFGVFVGEGEFHILLFCHLILFLQWLKKKFIYLTVLGLSCSMRDLQSRFAVACRIFNCSMQVCCVCVCVCVCVCSPAVACEFLAMVCKLLAEACGTQFPTRDRT